MADAGYNNYYAVLNASDYGIPQHRERVFIVSIRKDVDRDKFAFPQKESLRLRVKDLLEYDVDEKYYIDTDRARELIQKLAEERKLPGNDAHPVNIVNTEIERLGNMYEVTSKSGKSDGDVFGINGISSALTCKHPFKIVEVKQVGNLYPEAKFNNTQRGRVYDPEGCAPTINTMQGGGLEPKILQIGQLFPEDKIRNSQNGRVYSPEGCCPTMLARQYKDPHKILEVVSVRNGNFTGVVESIDTHCKAVGDLKVGGQKGLVHDTEKSMCTLTATQYKDPHKIVYNHRIRKLTPKECWRLMGFDDEDFEKAKAAGISNTQLYKQAGNSIVVQVLEKLFEKLLEAQKFEVEVK